MPLGKFHTTVNGKYKIIYNEVDHECVYCGQMVNFTFKEKLGSMCENCYQERRSFIRGDTVVVSDEFVEIDDMDIMEYNCIKNYIYNHLKMGRIHFYHDQRLAIVNILSHKVMKSDNGFDDIVDFFKMCTDFNEGITKKQSLYTFLKVKANRLKPPKCSTLIKSFLVDGEVCSGCVRRVRYAKKMREGNKCMT